MYQLSSFKYPLSSVKYELSSMDYQVVLIEYRLSSTNYQVSSWINYHQTMDTQGAHTHNVAQQMDTHNPLGTTSELLYR